MHYAVKGHNMYKAHCNLHIRYSVLLTVYTIPCIHCIQRILYTVQYTQMYSVHCTM